MIVTAGGQSLSAYWSECERQLFTLSGIEPVQYEQIILTVRALADDLKDITSTGQLTDAWENAEAMLTKAARAQGFSTNNLPQSKVAGTAFAFREREIIRQKQREVRQQQIREAQKNSSPWVMLEESGSIERGLFDPYRSTEMHVASGYALMSMVQADPGTGSPVYVVSAIKLDPKTGDLLDVEPGVEDWVEHDTQEGFRASQQTTRDKIASIAC